MRRLLLIVLLIAGLEFGLSAYCRSAWSGPNEDLRSASEDGDLEGVKSALKAEANVNARGKYSDPPVRLVVLPSFPAHGGRLFKNF